MLQTSLILRDFSLWVPWEFFLPISQYELTVGDLMVSKFQQKFLHF